MVSFQEEHIRSGQIPTYLSEDLSETDLHQLQAIQPFVKQAQLELFGFENDEIEIASMPVSSDKEVKELIERSQAGDQEARDTIVNRNTRLVWSVVQRFMNRGYDADDLFQIGCIGLIKSVDKLVSCYFTCDASRCF